MKQPRRGFIEQLKHYMNSLHLYCRLRSITGSKRKAMLICKIWESMPFYKMLYLKEIRDKRKEGLDGGENVCRDRRKSNLEVDGSG